MSKCTVTVKKWLGSVWFYFIAFVSFVLCAAIVFGWRRCVWLPSSRIDTELFGHFGDFVGGVLGTFFALVGTVLVVWTFRQQQESSTVQRFNDLFFQLLASYQQQVKDLNVLTARKHMDFFDFHMQKIQNRFAPQSDDEENEQEIMRLYMKFYIEYKNKLAIYFRTLFRIYDLIDHAQIREESKKNYLKIIRAELTESELFFLRYNGMCFYGRKFTHYLNKYHVLKHLPIFHLLEFKRWWGKMDEEERSGVDIFFYRVQQVIVENEKNFRPFRAVIMQYSERYQTVVTRIDKSSVGLFVVKKRSPNNLKEFEGFDRLSIAELRTLLEYFLKELLLDCGFRDKKFNDPDQLAFVTRKSDVTHGIEISCIVRNAAGAPLRFKYPIGKQ